MHIGERIRERRTELGLSQEELAHKLGYRSRASINKIELGYHGVDSSMLESFASELRTSVDYLLGIGENQKSVSQSDMELLDKYYKLPVWDRLLVNMIFEKNK